MPRSFLLTFLLLAACASGPRGLPGAEDLEAGAAAAQPGDASYHLLMGEIAMQRDENAAAASEYLKAARASSDPEVAARATRVTWAFGTQSESLQAAPRGAALAPEDPEPRGYLVRIHLREPDVDRALEHLEFLYDETAARPFLDLLPLTGDAGDRKAALEAMERLAAAHEEDASGAYAVSFLALRAGDADKAVTSARAAVDKEPEWTEAAMMYARALAAAGKADEALDWLEARPDGQSPEMRLERAVLLMAAERNEEARELLQALLKEEPDNPAALRALGYLAYFTGDLDAARRHFTSLLSTGRYGNDAMFYLGSIAEVRGNLEEAARLYSRVSGGENLVTAQVRLALVMYRMGRPELAVNHLEEFAEMQPEAALQLGGARAELLVRMDQTDRALDVYDDLLERHPESDDTRYARALLYERLDRIDEAVADLRHIAERNPDDSTALNALGYTLADRTDQLEEARGLIARALELAPDNPAIVDSMGWVLHKLGDDDEALKHLRQAWSLQRDPEVAAHLGEVLWSLGRKDEARRLWNEAIVEFPDSDVLLEAMGRLDP